MFGFLIPKSIAPAGIAVGLALATSTAGVHLTGEIDGFSVAQTRVMNKRQDRRQTIASGWASVGKFMTIAFVLDCAFQFVTARSIAVGEALILAILPCAVPYSLMRGPAARFVRK